MDDPINYNPGKHPFSQCLYFTANIFSRQLSDMAREEFSATGLSPSHAFIMMAVNKQPGIHPGKIAEIMFLAPSTITRLLDKMEMRNYITRYYNGRNIEVHPTPMGSSINTRLEKDWQNLIQKYTSAFGKKVTKNLTNQINESMKQSFSK